MNKYQEALQNTFKHIRYPVVAQKDYDFLKELVDKETPMKVEEELALFRCPNCNEKLLIYKMSINYCYECGQKLDWSEE